MTSESSRLNYPDETALRGFNQLAKGEGCYVYSNQPDINDFCSNSNRFSPYSLSASSVVLALSGCSGIQISYYDATSYTQLTGLKAETTLLVESFDTKPVNENKDKIEKVILYLRKSYEYDPEKGEPESDTG
ncbi:MAG: hypothetical protein GY744_04140 [Gammaproteobacteria bacterium]|nr:hypothetical protein [Gammaproteobacteria bacterium]